MARIVIDKERCKGCKICMNVCPKGLIQESKSTNSQGVHSAEFVDEKGVCLGCALCAQSCPDVAIQEVYK